MGKKKRKDLIEENENLTNTDVGFGTLEAEVNEVNNRFGTLDANQNNRFDALVDRLSALQVKMDYFMLQFSGQQNTAAAGGLGQGGVQPNRLQNFSRYSHG